MRLLDRYVLREMLGPALAALLGFVVLITGHVLFTVVDVVVGKGVRFENILQFAALKAPEAAVLAMPVATLLGCALALNRFASDNELMPMFAGGIGGYRLMGTALVLGLSASVISFGTKEFLVPMADRRAEELYREMLLRQKTLAFKPGQFLDTGGRWVFIADQVDRDRDRLMGLRALMRRPGQLPMFVRAQSAQFSDRTLWATGVSYIEFSFPDKLNYGAAESLVIDLGEIGGGLTSGDQLRNRPLRRLLRERASLAPGPPGSTRELDMEIHSRLSIITACIVFSLLSAPVALRFGRAQSLAGVLATLVVAFVYFLVMLGLNILGSNGALPVPVAAWAQNVVLVALALAAMRRL